MAKTQPDQAAALSQKRLEPGTRRYRNSRGEQRNETGCVIADLLKESAHTNPDASDLPAAIHYPHQARCDADSLATT